MKKLSDKETWKLLKKWKIPFAEQILVKTEEDTIKNANRIGYPIVLKISSRDVLHKTEYRAVKVDIRNEKEARTAYNEIMRNVKKKNPNARIDGMIVQKYIKGREAIVGSKYDPQFGPIILFGTGGVLVEVIKDFSIRLIPIQRKDAKEMIREIKAYPLLTGVRGMKPINFKKLEDVLLKVSEMIWKEKRIKEFDINPLFVNEHGALAVDIRVLV